MVKFGPPQNRSPMNLLHYTVSMERPLMLDPLKPIGFGEVPRWTTTSHV